jgi:hypothetical protein
MKRIDKVAKRVLIHQGKTEETIQAGEKPSLQGSQPLKVALYAQNYFKQHSQDLLEKVGDSYEAHIGSKAFEAQLEKTNTPEEMAKCKAYWENNRDKVLKEVTEYFEGKVNLLQGGQVIALPYWYHATGKERFDKILASGYLKQSPAPTGMGVYFSTDDERGQYGEYTFAMDDNRIRSFEGGYTQPTAFVGFAEPAMFVRIEEDVPMRARDIAHIVVKDEKAKAALIKQLPTLKNPQGQALTCPVVTEMASAMIREVLHQNYVDTLPEHWKSIHKKLTTVPFLKEIVLS